MKNLSNSITTLKAELNKLPELTGEQKEKLWRKFRLEWNYNSNHIEGNTLTYGQTELLIFFDKATGEKDMREYEEMKAHDVAIKFVQEEASNQEKHLTESFIRELNEIILVKPFYKEAQTIDGQNTRRLIEIGQYKKFPNSVRLQNGEMFHYTKPEEVAAEMEKLVNWHNQEKELSPEDLAAYLHYRFVRIHPFDDGNGRVARLLMNYVLLKHHLPPVIIKSADKANYLLALNKADIGDTKAFADYISDQLIWSLQLQIKAANNESLDEPDDLDKEIELLKRNRKKELVEIQKTKEVLIEMTTQIISPLVEKLSNKINKFSELFMSNETILGLNNGLTSNGGFLINNVTSITNKLLQRMTDYEVMDNFALFFILKGYKNNGTNSFTITKNIYFIFQDYKFTISYGLKTLDFLYHQSINEAQQNQIADEIAKSVLEEIKEKVG
ncbi:MAG: Fic family protein [Bacteroidia bacterium]